MKEKITTLLVAFVALLVALLLIGTMYSMHPGKPMIPPSFDCSRCHTKR